MSTNARDELMKESQAAVDKCMQLVAGFLEDEERAKAVKTLYDITKVYCLLEERANFTAATIQQAKLQSEEEGGEEMSFEQNINLQIKEEERNIKNIETHPKFIAFDKKSKAVLAQGDEGSEGADSEGEGDDELRVTEAEVNTIDPISQQTMVSPVKNKICGHSYEKTSILEMLSRKKRLRCPYVGCPNRNHFGPGDLEEDQRLKQILKRQRTK